MKQAFEIVLLVCGVLLLGGCGRSNNVLLGRVEATVGGHVVVVTDCYRTEVPLPESRTDAGTGETVWTFAPCRDAVVEIRGQNLTVNGRQYGRLNDGDVVLVDHGRVLVNDHDVAVSAT